MCFRWCLTSPTHLTSPQRDDTIILLLEKLRKKAQWVDSDAGRYWAETLFPNIDVCERMGRIGYRTALHAAGFRE